MFFAYVGEKPNKNKETTSLITPWWWLHLLCIHCANMGWISCGASDILNCINACWNNFSEKPNDSP